MAKNYEEVAYYQRIGDLNADVSDFLKCDKLLPYVKKHGDLSISGKHVSYYFDHDICLGTTKPLEREGYSRMLTSIVGKHIKLLVVNDLTAISTEPKELARSLYDLVQRGVKIFSICDESYIDSNNISEFDYGCALAQVYKLIADNANTQYKLLVHKEGRYKIWNDTIENLYYCYFERTKELLRIEQTAKIEKDKWDKRQLTQKALEIYCSSTEYSQFCEVLTYGNTEYYVHFSIDYSAMTYGCGAILDDSILAESQEVIKKIRLRRKGILN